MGLQLIHFGFLLHCEMYPNNLLLTILALIFLYVLTIVRTFLLVFLPTPKSWILICHLKQPCLLYHILNTLLQLFSLLQSHIHMPLSIPYIWEDTMTNLHQVLMRYLKKLTIYNCLLTLFLNRMTLLLLHQCLLQDRKLIQSLA